jgi:uncharacterized protein (TIGR00255 family)
MTGFGAAEGTVGPARVTVELRSVNHRFFNSTIRLPAELSRWEGEAREALRRRISRGHVAMTARLVRDGAGTTIIDEERFAAYVALLRELQERHHLSGFVDVGTVLRMPDVISSMAEADGTDSSAFVSVVDTAAAALSKSREEEGTRLVAYLLERLSVIDAAVARIAQRAPARLVEQRDRLREAVKQLADGVAVDPQRVAGEVAILADRLDIQEELSRLRSHLEAVRRTLNEGADEPVGKRLGFLLQEMLREANTTGSKANDAAMLADVVTIKEELERIREQVENLE